MDKKKFYIIIIIFVTLLLSGCGSKDTGTIIDEQKNGETTPVLTPTSTPTIMPIIDSTFTETLESNQESGVVLYSKEAFPQPEKYGDLYNKFNTFEQWLLTEEGIKSRVEYFMSYFNLKEDDASYLITAFYDWQYGAFDPVNYDYDNEAKEIDNWVYSFSLDEYITFDEAIRYIIELYKSGEKLNWNSWGSQSYSDLIVFYYEVIEVTGDIHNTDEYWNSQMQEYDLIDEDYIYYEALSDEQIFLLETDMMEFDYNNTLRNIYNIGSYYTGESKWIIVPGVITYLKMTGMIDNTPSYVGIIRTTKPLLDNYNYVFTYVGNDFYYIEGDSITVYGIIQAETYITNNNGKESLSLEISVLEHKSGVFIDNYEMNEIEKNFYLNKTYIDERGISIYVSPALDKIGERSVYDVHIRKHGDGGMQIGYKCIDIEYSRRDSDDYIHLYPNGKLYSSINNKGTPSGEYFLNE